MDISHYIDLISKNELSDFLFNGDMIAGSFVKLTDVLKNNSTLKCFCLASHCNNDNTIDELFHLIDVLSTNKTLEYLGFCCMMAGDDFVIKICEAFQYHNYISIDVSRNLIGQKGIDALANLLNKNKNIKKLYFGEDNLNSLNVSTIFNMLHNNSSLKKLSITGTLNDGDVDSLASMLRENKKLITLSVDRTEYVIHILVKLLRENVNIKSLRLYDPIDEDINIICDVLINNTKMKSLIICGEQFTFIDIFKLAKLLKVNTNLKKISLNGNHDNINSLLNSSLLSDALCKNISINKIYFNHLGIDKVCWDNFIDAIQENYTIIDFGVLNRFTDKTVKFIERNIKNSQDVRLVKVKPVQD